MTSLEQDLDMTNGRIIELEKDLMLIQDNMQTLFEQLKETQKYIIKLAHNQAHMTKRISSWPYIAVEKFDDGDED
jgi:uncharacterized coiled-coil protein SlyX